MKMGRKMIGLSVIGNKNMLVWIFKIRIHTHTTSITKV